MRSIAIVLLLVSLGCSSKNDGAPVDPGEDTGTTDDTGGGDDTTADTAPPPACAAGEKTGAVGKTDGLKTINGVKFNVRTPATYDPTAATPLVVVYAPAGADPFTTETFTKLTPDVLGRGWLIAYLDHVTPSTPATAKGAASVAQIVSDSWCVDQTRIYLTGHSDGGSTTSIIAIGKLVNAAAIGPSAAGVNGAYLASQTCPPPLPVMVMHGKNDTLFPGFGKEAADWWQKCFKCTVGAALPNGCIPYTGCEGAAEVLYCERNTSHPTWPNMNADLLDFFARFTRK